MNARNQIGERLLRNPVLRHGPLQGYENRMFRVSRIHAVQLRAPLVQLPQTFLAIRRISSARSSALPAVRVHVVEILMQMFRQQETDHVKILVMVVASCRVCCSASFTVMGERSWNDGCFERSAALHQPEQYSRKIPQRLLGLHEILRPDAAGFNDVERLTKSARRVMETRLAGDFRIMQQVGIELDTRASGRPAEES